MGVTGRGYPRSIWLGVLFLFGVALFTRLPYVGDPTVGLDEQFYLVVADRMWHGDLPFVDIWDRKPIGLFLIYALLRPLSADGVLAYQIAALFIATATAFVIARIATRFTSESKAFLSGALYLFYVPLIGGVGGQSPIFYNLAMAGAALLIVKAAEADRPRARLMYPMLAMLLVGLALQIKYSAIVEGFFFGLYLLWLRRRARGPIIGDVVHATALMVCALAPTILAFGFFILKGHGDAFYQANFKSIFQVHEPAGFSDMHFLIGSAYRVGPLLLASLISFIVMARRSKSALDIFLYLWCASAFIGFFIIGHYYSHYALPMLVPLAVLNAAILSRRIVAIVMLGGLALVAFAAGSNEGEVRARNIARIGAMVDVLAPRAKQGCIYLNDGPTIVYMLTRSCLPTPYIFPEHLNNQAEAQATNATEAMRALIARRPSAIVIADRILDHPRNAVTASMLDRAVSANYHLAATLDDIYRNRKQMVFVRNDLP